MTKSMKPSFFVRLLCAFKSVFFIGIRPHRIFGIRVHCERNPKENYPKIHDALALIRDFDDALFSFVTRNIWAIYYIHDKRGPIHRIDREGRFVIITMWPNAYPLFLAAELVRLSSYIASSEERGSPGAQKAELIFLMKLGTEESRKLAEYVNSNSSPQNRVDDLSVLESAEIINRKDRYY